jgi:hypothetical protein
MVTMSHQQTQYKQTQEHVGHITMYVKLQDVVANKSNMEQLFQL